MTLFFKLLLAHLVIDFIVQTNKSVREKDKKKIKSGKLYVHALLHGALSMLFVWDIHFWKYAILITLSHFAIDLGKIYFQQKASKRLAFFIDQALHLAVLGWAAHVYNPFTIDYQWLFSDQNLAFLVAAVFLTKPTSVIIKIFISKWTPTKQDDESLQNAGNWIGMLERLLIFAFILAGKWDAIGFLLTAKSVFRFGDLKESKDRKLTEYILIGTLTSFGIAIIIGVLYLNIVQQ